MYFLYKVYMGVCEVLVRACVYMFFTMYLLLYLKKKESEKTSLFVNNINNIYCVLLLLLFQNGKFSIGKFSELYLFNTEKFP